ncbi:MAG: hypothetical protein Kow0042_15950 [Calditrichia bacterium]
MEYLLNKIMSVDPFWAYCLLFISAFVENVFPPIPGDTVTVIGAYLVGIGILNFWLVFLTTTLGSILGFMTIFAIAYWVEWKIIERYQPKWISRSKIDRVENWFRQYGYWIILFNRFLSGMRSVISLFAGLSKMNGYRVFILALVSCLMWNGALIYLGSVIGSNWQDIATFLQHYNRIVLILLAGILIIYIFYRLSKRSRT